METENYFTLIAALGAPILIGMGSLITWVLKTKKEEYQAIEARALEKRLETYNRILDPMIVLFAKASTEKEKEKAIAQISTVEYRKAGFNLITFGSDELVNSYNEMMQSFFKSEADNNPKAVMKKYAHFILCIRKDLHNRNTKLKDWDMLKFMITDIEKIME